MPKVILTMTPEQRVERLSAAAKRMGGNAQLGRALGYQDGAFIGQMLRRERAISEKTLIALAALRPLADLFDVDQHVDATPSRKTPPLLRVVAREASLSQYTVSPLKTAEEIMQGKINGDEFRFALPDDAMAPEHPAGLHIIFSQSRAPRHGLIVLVRTKHGELHVRQHAQGREPGHWLAVPRQAVYASFDCHDDGLIILGVMRGTYDPRD